MCFWVTGGWDKIYEHRPAQTVTTAQGLPITYLSLFISDCIAIQMRSLDVYL